MKTSSLLGLLESHKVVIPMIQRDYAQGRAMGKIPDIRKRFVEDLRKALTNSESKAMELDFIYGYMAEHENNAGERSSSFTPLDGQQRLTTLFLLHWFIAAKEGFISDAQGILSKFSYATRQSSRQFCEKLVKFVPEDWSQRINKTIEDQPWFFASWAHDPTIASMLVVLEEIETAFRTTSNIWPVLIAEKPRIVFHLLQMEQLGLPDDLYIKMNSRGKELTDFEYFKSQFSDLLDENNAKLFNERVDQGWSDLFWNQFKSSDKKDLARLVDAGFLRFFWFVTDILIVKQSIPRAGKSWLELAKAVYAGNAANVSFLFSCLDLFEVMDKNDPGFFGSLFYLGHVNYKTGKTRLFFQNNKINLFKKCVETYDGEVTNNPFTIREQLMLYACMLHLKSRGNDFPAIIRKIRNLLTGTGDQIRNDNLASLYQDIENLVSGKPLAADSKFSNSQCSEEEKKADFLQKHPELIETVYRLEDHDLMRGTIAIFDFDSTIAGLASAFQQQFAEGANLISVSRAMLSIGDYSRGYGRLWRVGNDNRGTWRELLIPNDGRDGFVRTKGVLKEYLQEFVADPEMSNEVIISRFSESFVADSNRIKDWRYYCTHYVNFRYWKWIWQQTEGYYFWNDWDNRSNEFIMLFRSQFNGRHWSPFLLELSTRNEKCHLENYGNDLQFTLGEFIFKIANVNSGFKFKADASDLQSQAFLRYLLDNQLLIDDGLLKAKQNDKHQDVEDRIVMAEKFLVDLEQYAADFKALQVPDVNVES